MNRNAFEKLVAEAVNGLPEEFLRKLENVEILVEDFASDEVMDIEGLESPYDLLGYYEGTPLTERESPDAAWLPDRITIYQQPIESICSNRRELLEEIQRTVVHEVAHFFGIGEERLRELGWD